MELKDIRKYNLIQPKVPKGGIKIKSKLKLESNQKLKIGIDLDDTIWKFHEKFFEYYNEKFGTDHKIGDHKDYSLERTFNISKEEVFKLLDEFTFSDSHHELELIEEVIDSMKKLNETYEIYFITARHEGLFEITFKKLKKHFDFDFKILFVFDKYRKLNKEKVDYCLEKKIDIIIDDRMKTVNSCSANGIKCFLLDNPWNQEIDLHENIIRVNGWNEIMEELGK